MPLPLSLLPSLARAVDVSTRNDAISGCIVGERDYVASYLATLRNVWRLLGGSSELFVAVLPPSLERAIGCDYAVVLQAEDWFKLVFVEAKWARPDWDERRAPSALARAHYFPPPAAVPPKISRFSDQIDRQAAWLLGPGHHEHFIAEMFLQVVSPAAAVAPYNNLAFFDQLGSTFITHARAREVVVPPPIGGTMQFSATLRWHSSAGGALSGQQVALGGGHGLDAAQLLDGVVECRFGKVIHGAWQDHLAALGQELGADPTDLHALRALGLRQLLVVGGLAPPQWKKTS